MSGQKSAMAQLTAGVQAAMREKGYDPILKQIELTQCLEQLLVAKDERTQKPLLSSFSDRAQVLKLLALLHQGLTTYFTPALRAIEMQADITEEVNISILDRTRAANERVSRIRREAQERSHAHN